MVMIVIGLLLLVAKLADFGPTAGWSWWAVAVPFGAAVLWWQFADSTGLTQRREMQKMDERKAKRRDRALEALGLGTRATGTGQAGARGSPRPPGRCAAPATGTRARSAAARPAPVVLLQSRSSTAPRLALAALRANLASTPRV